ncbi:hypothetical protein ACRALDRAFT_1063384 [Sodiomyces alcalophilus JCM 7366]|uniref:uncharacterized protein n=1 Tax=Sodiomyces alcalophilus JCM 7366 TaxID=591952 RepID=UPI0039B5CDF5
MMRFSRSPFPWLLSTAPTRYNKKWVVAASQRFSTGRPLGKNAEPSEDLLYPPPPTTRHSDLKSFLAYADRTALDPTSSVYVGTHYEYTVASTLSRYGIAAKRCGGASDLGVDLLGTWRIPVQAASSPPPPLRVIVQCKAGSRRIGPALIRELEGSFVGAPVGWRGAGVLALLVTEGTATKGVRDSLGRSNWPMGFISCSRDGVVRQILWNKRAEDEGLEGLGVGLRHTGSGDSEPEIILTYHNMNLPLLDRQT